MNWTSEPFTSISTYVPSSSEDDSMMIGTIPCYAPGVLAHTDYSGNPQPATGLGIMYSAMETQFSQLEFCSAPESIPLSTTDWSDQLMPSMFNSSLEIGNLSAGTCYESFGGHHDVSASPHSLYSPQTLSASPSYCSTMDVGGQDAMGGQPSHMWPNTPCSDTPLEGWCDVKEEPGDCPDPLLFADSSNAAGLPTSTSIPQVVVNNAFAGLASSDEEGLDPLMKSDHTMKGSVEYDRGATVLDLPAKAISLRNEDGSMPLNDGAPCKVQSASGLVCTVCGTCFTRRSNCREHMKRHDPNCRKLYPCEACGKDFGRRTDLKRHVDSIHKGLRKFGCDQCDRRFSRQDTLSRHKADGCRRKPRKSNPKSKEPTDKSSQHLPASPSDLHYRNKPTKRNRDSSNN